MNYLTVENLSKSVGEKELFADISFGLEKGQKTALIARNGTGKSTLLNIIAGIDEADSGQVVIRKDIMVSYLPQVDSFADDFSVLDTIFDTQTPTIQAFKEYEACILLSDSEKESPEGHQRLQKAILEMDRLHAWDFEARAKEILSRFGIDDVFKNVRELSGGQRKKAALAKTLITDTDLLILDEPTNHLDVEMIEWLENYLKAANITLLMVTHDRHFLDQVCNDIIEIDHGQLYHYRGKYDYFIEKKAERLANAAAENEKMRQLFRKELAWVHTSPQARTSKNRARINAFEDLKKEVSKVTEQKNEGFKVRTERLGNKILEINNLDFSYPGNKLLDDFSYIFKKGEKCGIVGPNGTGKSTLLKLIMGELKADGGKITPGQTIQFGYYAQDGLPFGGNKRIIDIVKEQAEVIRLDNGNFMGASQFLNHFGFKYEQQYTYYEDLSGGERRKLYLLITLLRNPNFLILDEPTNDFDIDTLNLLEDFLENYEGCILMVSHDRWFMNKLVDHIFVFEGNGKIRDYYGNYTEYRIERDKEIQLQKRIAKINTPVSCESNDSRRARTTNSNKMSFKERKEFEALSEDIDRLEAEKKNLIEKMNLGQGSSQELIDWGNRYQEIENQLDEKSMRWLELSEKDE